MTSRLPLPEPGPEAASSWVTEHLGDLAGDAAPPSRRYRGGQRAADAALAAYDVAGYAARRNEVWPAERRGASGNAFNAWSETTLRKGVGMGIRWYSIAGPIRLDIAWAIDEQDKPWRLHFTIGSPLL